MTVVANNKLPQFHCRSYGTLLEISNVQRAP